MSYGHGRSVTPEQRTSERCLHPTSNSFRLSDGDGCYDPAVPPPYAVHHVRLGALASLDFVDAPDDKVVLVVFAERGAIQKRTLARVPYDEIEGVLRFLGRVLTSYRATGDDEPTPPPAPAPKMP